jgi:hypothetical protein
VTGLGVVVVKEEFLLAGDGGAVAGGGVEGPILDGGQDRLVYRWAEAADEFELRDMAERVDDDVDDDVTVGVGGELVEVGFGRRVEVDEGECDVAGAEGVVAGGGGVSGGRVGRGQSDVVRGLRWGWDGLVGGRGDGFGVRRLDGRGDGVGGAGQVGQENFMAVGGARALGIGEMWGEVEEKDAEDERVRGERAGDPAVGARGLRGREHVG